MKSDVFDIKGMSCSACVAHVEKAVKKLDGIQALNVNLLTNSMSVRYDESNISASEIRAAVNDIGYEAVVRTKEEMNEDTAHSTDNLKKSSF